MKVVLFDLDNTLFDVRQYYVKAFERIADYLARHYDISKQLICKKLLSKWEEKTSMYQKLFDDVMETLGHKAETLKIVEMFNDFDGPLFLDEETQSVLDQLQSQGHVLGLVTDGNVKRQKRKVRALGIEHYFNVIVYCQELGVSKLDERPYREAISKLGVRPEDTFYVGDNPKLDFEGAKKVGLKTIRIIKGEFGHFADNNYIDFKIKNMPELPRIINND